MAELKFGRHRNGILRYAGRVCTAAVLLALAQISWGQQLRLGRTLTTIAGLGPVASNGATDNIPASSAQLGLVFGVALDAAKTHLYIADATNSVIRKMDLTTGIITTIAGTSGHPGISGDGGPATAALLGEPRGIAVDPVGRVYIADHSADTVRVIGTNGTIQTLIGQAAAMGSQDGSGTSARLSGCSSLALDPNGNLFIADTGNGLIRRYSPSTLMVTTPVGPGTTGFTTGMKPLGVAVDTDGTVYFSDFAGNLVRKLSGNTLTTVASGMYGPSGVALDGSGSLFISTGSDNSVYQLTLSAVGTAPNAGLHRIAGSGIVNNTPTYKSLFRAMALYPGSGALSALGGLVVGANGVVYLATGNQGSVFNEPSGPGSITALQYTTNVALPIGATTGTIVMEVNADTVGLGASAQGDSEFSLGSSSDCPYDQSTTYPAGTVCTYPATFTPTLAGRRSAQLLLSVSNAYTFTTFNFVIEANGYLSQANLIPGSIDKAHFTVQQTYTGGPYQPPTDAVFGDPEAIAFGQNASGYLSDSGTSTIYSFTGSNPNFNNAISKLFGGTAGFTGDGGAAFNAKVNGPTALLYSPDYKLYIADTGNHRVRVVDLNTYSINTYAGDGGTTNANDGAIATSASLSSPVGLAFALDGSLLIADAAMHRVRRVDAITKIITTIAGSDIAGAFGDGLLATSATLNAPWGVAVGPNGDIYISDANNNTVRRIDATTGIISIYAGTGQAGATGDRVSATSAQLNQPRQLLIDATGGLYIADSGNNLIRYVTRPAPGSAQVPVILAVAGSTTATSVLNGGSSVVTRVLGPQAMALDSANRLFFAEQTGQDFRYIITTAGYLYFPDTAVTYTSQARASTIVQTGTVDPSIGSTFLPVGIAADTATPPNFPFFPSYPSILPSCPQLTQGLQAGEACTLGLQFTPQTTGLLAGNINVSETGVAQGQTIQLFGTGVFTPFNFAPTELQDAKVGVAYNRAVTVTGGSGALTLVEAGALPNGITFTATGGNGSFTGTTTAAGNFPFTLQVTDAAGNTKTQSYALFVGYPAAVISFVETIKTTDAPLVQTAVAISFIESIHTSDAPAVASAVSIAFTESIHTTDAPAVTPQLASQSITFTLSPSQANYAGQTYTLTASASSGLPVTFTSSDAKAVISGNQVKIKGAGTFTIVANQPGNGSYAAAPPVGRNLTIHRATVNVTADSFTRAYQQPNPTLTYSIQGLVDPDTKASVGTPVLTTAATANSPAGQYPIFVSDGTLDQTNYSYVETSGQLTITGGAAQTITFARLPASLPLHLGTLALSATSTSGLAIVYTVTGPASITGNHLTLQGVGTVTVTATQPGNATFNPAAAVARSFQVTP